MPLLVAILTAGAVAWRAAAEFRVKRHVEITDRFMRLVEVAEGKFSDLRESTRAERIAAVELVAAFGRRDKLFRRAAESFLESVGDSSEDEEVRYRAEQARNSLALRSRARIPGKR